MNALPAISLTFACYFFTSWLLNRPQAARLAFLPAIIWAALLLMAVLAALSWHYADYYHQVSTLFDHLLGYVVVALAIPLAAMNWRDVPLKRIGLLVLVASLSGVALPVGLAWLWQLSPEQILAFVTRSVTTPIALTVAGLIHAPAVLVSLIVIVSGLLGAAAAPWLLRDVTDARARGLALGLVAHAIGTVEAWRQGPECGRYAALGMALNGIFTALWTPWVVQWLYHQG